MSVVIDEPSTPALVVEIVTRVAVDNNCCARYDSAVALLFGTWAR